MVVSHHVVAGIWTQDLQKSSQCSKPLSHLANPWLPDDGVWLLEALSVSIPDGNFAMFAHWPNHVLRARFKPSVHQWWRNCPGLLAHSQKSLFSVSLKLVSVLFMNTLISILIAQSLFQRIVFNFWILSQSLTLVLILVYYL